jgi:serine O-acetyltransferase
MNSKDQDSGHGHDASSTSSPVKRDLRRYFALDSSNGNPSILEKIRIVIGTPGLQAILVYRFGSWVDRKLRFAPLRIPAKLLYLFLDKLCIICWGIHIHIGAQIDGGLYIGHYGGILIGPVKMGNDCNIAHGVTIGQRAGSGLASVPTIGNRVWIGAGCILFGGIKIGDGVTIGPLTVVGRNVPPGVLVMGNPMRLLRKNYDNSSEIYGETPRP